MLQPLHAFKHTTIVFWFIVCDFMANVLFPLNWEISFRIQIDLLNRNNSNSLHTMSHLNAVKLKIVFWFCKKNVFKKIKNKKLFSLIVLQVPNLPLQITSENASDRTSYCLHHTRYAEQQNLLYKGEWNTS